MNATRIRNRFGGFTLIELLTVIAIIGILAAMLLPVLSRSKARARRIQCVSGLREIGQGFLLFANDHGGKFPMQVSTNDGGSLEYVTAGYQTRGPFYLSYRHFLPLAGELSTPNLLACPADLERSPAVNFSAFNNWNLSYVIGLKADPGLPGVILAGDRTLPTGPLTNGTSPTIQQLPPPLAAFWGRGLHERKGNLLFGDDHVEESNDAQAPAQEAAAENVVYPDVDETQPPPGQSTGSGSTPSPVANPYASYYTRPPAAAAYTPTASGTSYSTMLMLNRTAVASSSGAAHSPGGGPFGNQPGAGNAPARFAAPQATPGSMPAETNGPGAVAADQTSATNHQGRAVAAPIELTFPQVLAQTAGDSWRATSWLIWLLLLLVLIILLLRRLERRHRRPNPAKP